MYGSLYVVCAINSKVWVNKPGGNYANVYDIVDKPVLTEMNKPDITYSVNGAWGHKLVCPSGTIKPVNGKAEFVLSFKTQCAGPVQGAGAYYGDSLAQAIQPTISVQVVAQTPSGPANVSGSIKVPDACLEKKDLTVYGN